MHRRRRRFLRRSQPPANEEAKKKPEEDWKEESTDQAKIKDAYEHGAAAILLVDPEEEATSSGSRRRSSRSSRAGDFKPQRDFLCFTIGDRVFRAIMKQDPQLSPRGLTRQVDQWRREIKMKRPQSRACGHPGDIERLRHARAL